MNATDKIAGQRLRLGVLCRTLRVLVLVVLAAASVGCSAIGFTTGAIVDSRQVAAIGVTGAEVLAVGHGSSVEAVLRDGSSVTGKYSGAVTDTGDPYGPAFARSRERLLTDYPIPRLGSRVTIADERTYIVGAPTLTLLGMDRQHVFLKAGRRADTVPWTELRGSGT